MVSKTMQFRPWLVVLFAAVGMTGCKASAVEDTPKAVALAYYDGILEGDASKSMAALDLPSERTRAVVRVMLVAMKATMDIDDACTARFGKPMLGLRNDAAQHRREVEQGEFRVEGDIAVLPLPSSPQDSIIMKRVNGHWRMAKKSTEDPGIFMSADQAHQYEQRVSTIGQKVSADVRAGTYSDCREGVTAGVNLIADTQTSIMASEKNCLPTRLRQWRVFLKLGCVSPQYVCENLTMKKLVQSMTEDDDAKGFVKDAGAASATLQVMALVHDGRGEAACAPDPDTY